MTVPFYCWGEDTLVVRANRHSVPATFIQNDQWKGMDIDIVKELFSRAGLTYQFVEMPIKRSLLRMESGENHITLNISKNEKRSEYINWLGPIRITGAGLIVSESNKNLPINSYQDLINMAQKYNGKFGYINGSSYSDFFDEKLQNDANLRSSLYLIASAKQGFDMLSHQRLLGVISDDFEFNYLLKNNSKEGYKELRNLALHNYRIEGSVAGSYIGVSKKLEASYYQKLLAAFQEMKADGTFAQIHQQWTGTLPDF